MSLTNMRRDPALYDASKDPAMIEAANQLPRCKATAEEVWRAFENAEPEQQLCVICLLEVWKPGDLSLTDLKREAVERLCEKLKVAVPK